MFLFIILPLLLLLKTVLFHIFLTTATSSLPLNFTTFLPLIYHGSTVVLPWQKDNLRVMMSFVINRI